MFWLTLKNFSPLPQKFYATLRFLVGSQHPCHGTHRVAHQDHVLQVQSMAYLQKVVSKSLERIVIFLRIRRIIRIPGTYLVEKNDFIILLKFRIQ